MCNKSIKNNWNRTNLKKFKNTYKKSMVNTLNIKNIYIIIIVHIFVIPNA